MIQLVILLTSALAIWLVNSTDPSMRMYACVVGLVGQPFWFYTSYVNRQWGVFLGSFIFTASWIKGIMLYYNI